MAQFNLVPALIVGAVGALVYFGSPIESALPSTVTTSTLDAYPGSARPLRMEEHLSRKTYRCSSGTITSYPNQHVVQAIFSDGGGAVPTTTTGGFAGVHRVHTFVDPPGGGSTTGTSTGGTTGGGTHAESFMYIFVPEGEEFGEIPENTSLAPTPSAIKFAVDGTPIPGMRYLWTSGYHYPVQISSSSAIAGRTLYVGLITYVNTVRDSDSVVLHTDVTSWYGTYALSRTNMGDASIDTRKAYGQPNSEGELPGDPNADLRPVNFGDYIFRGGLFAGVTPFATGDQSGLARIQLYAASSTHVNTQLATVVMLDEGNPPNVTGSLTLGSFCPSATDPNLATTESSVTWPTGWTINPRSSASNPPDPVRDPTEKVTFSGAATDYASWNLATVTTTAVTLPETALTSVCIAIDNEPNVGGPVWRYFGSKEFQTNKTTFPANDSAPRLWVFDLTQTQTGTYRVF